MKILLISPVKDLKSRTTKELLMPQMALYILKGLTPRKHEVKIVEEELEDINLDEDCDLVGISCMTSNAPRAYELSTEFRKRNKTVVLGGVHPTLLPDEALQYADSVVVGESEGVWEELLNDYEKGILRKKYHLSEPDLNRHITKDFGKVLHKIPFGLVPILTPYNCEFCCVSNLYGKKIRHIPVENVVRDIIESKAKNFMFLDDNIIGHTRYAKELFEAIKPLKINWVGQASISFAKDSELMQLVADSGCRGLFFGVESVSDVQQQKMQKTFKGHNGLEIALKKIKKKKILIHASVIFGFDYDTSAVFKDTVKFLIKNKVSSVSFNILTPYPGTETYTNFCKQGRLITDDWKYYDHNTVVFKPLNMSPFDLQKGKAWAKNKFYKPLSVLRRLIGNMPNIFIFLALNYGFMKTAKAEMKRVRRQLP
ncbi:MAG: B12-binding domain-containing radical SAM protein [Bacteroidia bacterium]|nr:B12-binding domain-containing radical SAM protein [Bacteroidia bacterium]